MDALKLRKKSKRNLCARILNIPECDVIKKIFNALSTQGYNKI